jgi:hypothetical protein
MYAAHDAVASLRVYRAVSSVPVDPINAREA